MQEINVALLGFGNVGRAFARYLLRGADPDGAPLRLRAAADSSGAIFLDDPATLARLLEHKEGGGSISSFTASSTILGIESFIAGLRERGVSTLIETLPTDFASGRPALDYLRLALESGVNVVTANKGPLAHGFAQLNDAARASGARFAFAGTTGVRPPSELAGRRVLEIRGVLNGTTNFVLSRMQEGESFAAALREAQEAGIAEPDPRQDIEGWDTAVKILILANDLMGAGARIEEVSRIGIGPETESLIEVARERGRRVRLVGRARIWQGRVRLSVAPKIVEADSPFFDLAGTSKRAVFRIDDGPPVLVDGLSGRDAISRVILEDVLRVEGRGELLSA